ncbi:MAG: MHYT domain-containing protein, partial [Pseudomonadota bacterium]
MTAASHNIFLVVASIAVSLVAAFTGLAITNSIAALPESKRKALVVMSAFILGGGIWSMHFVAMLAHEFSAPVYYDSLQTLSSALIAILVAGLALLMLHFSARTPIRLASAGVILGVGIVVMHYVGMLAIRGVIPDFSVLSVLLAILVAAFTGVVAIRVAYGHRSKQNIVYGSVVFG